MKKPFIALTPSHDVKTGDIFARSAVLRAVSAAGGIPVALPLETGRQELRQIAGAFDGFLFTGGPDVHPFLFGQQTHPLCGGVSEQRDALELSLLREVLALQKPILGICRGIQLINLGLGGAICQDISQEQKSPAISHSQPFSYDLPCHLAHLAPGSRLALSSGQTTLSVNSMHHQAVTKAAPGLNACGYSPDGFIEAIEAPDYPFLIGVQWHPEYLCPRSRAAQKLFLAFINACSLRSEEFPGRVQNDILGH